jgi:predicted small integral membrane protein
MQLSLAGGLSLYFTLVFVNNLVDWPTNFAFVEHVLAMDTIFPTSSLKGRSLVSPLVHHLVYGLIIAGEGLIAGLSICGCLQMISKVRASGPVFNHAKQLLLWALVGAFCLWFVGFIGIGSEWFAMWQSKLWNGKSTAMDITLVCLGSFLILCLEG